MSFFPAFWAYTRLTGRYRGHLKERLGFIPPRVIQGLLTHPRIWIHAVSLGEVKVAASMIDALRRKIPNCSIIVSTITEHGRMLAGEAFGETTPVIYAPIDFVAPVRRALSTVRPDLLVFLETEIWPAWLFEAARMGIKTALINGRISVRSIGGYMRLRPFFRKVLTSFDAFSMISEADGIRIKAMGADPQKVEINGNAKYELLGKIADPRMQAETQQLLSLTPSQKVIIAGSTREGEETMVLDAYEKILTKYPDTILLIAPRHIERTREISSLVERQGFRYHLWGDLDSKGISRRERVVIINTFGELFKVYSVGTVIFCGASLVPLGGQNPLEPAVWGKVVFYGPHMEDFLDATALLEAAGAGVLVSGPEMLAEKAVWYFDHPDDLKMCGDRARKVVLKNQGASERHTRVILRLLRSGR